jgi:hypothetical protein
MAWPWKIFFSSLQALAIGKTHKAVAFVTTLLYSLAEEYRRLGEIQCLGL